MAEKDAALEKLRPVERARLDRFAQAFDRIDASAYARFVDTTADNNVRAAEQAALSLEPVTRALDGKAPKRVIVVPDRIVNIVA